jgi:ATPase subunit of ABC transporter with duplicated ATPase domains
VLAELGFVDLDLFRPVRTLSGGEVMLFALAARLLARPDVLILDEPTNNLDRTGRARLRSSLVRWRRPVVVVSHDRELLEEMDAIAELRAGEIRFYGGNFTAYTQAVEAEQAAAERAVRAAKGDLRRQQRDLIDTKIKLDRSQRYGKTKAARGMPKMAANFRQNSAELSAGRIRGGLEADVAAAREGLDVALERVRDDEVIKIELPGTSVPTARDVAVMTDVVLRNHVQVSLHLRGPERLAITGPNGSGKTTLIDTLRGALAPLSGSASIKVPYRLLPQRLQLLDDDETVLAGVARHAPTADHHELRAQLARFLLDADTIQRRVATLSGGERFRASLAALLLAEPPPQLLILDEPTNNLDLDSVAQLTAALRAYRGALLVVSHDEPFLAELDITRRLELVRHGQD